MKQLILTALDDNNKVYYDLFIPFILSLKETDYKGDIGVVSYDLSPEKEETLRKHGLLVFPASRYCKQVHLDRHLTAGDIAEKYDYDQIAFYDCDIWFPSQHLTIFEQIQNKTALYCSYDSFSCTFLGECVEASLQGDIWAKLNQVKSRNNGRVWHVGVVAGNTTAWKAYKAWLLKSIKDPKYLLDVYGIDTTLMNLYSLTEKEALLHLPEKYNCLPTAGIAIGFDFSSNKYTHKLNGEFIEGIHVIGDYRHDATFSYGKWHSEHLESHAKEWRHKHYPYFAITLDTCRTPQDRAFTTEPVELALNSIKANAISYGFRENDTIFTVRGDSEICIKNKGDTAVNFQFYWQNAMNLDPLSKVYIRRHDEDTKLTIEGNSLYGEVLEPGKTLTFITDEVNVDGRGIDWVFSQVRLI